MDIPVNAEVTRFDMRRKPMRQMQILRPVTWALSFPAVWKHHTKIERVGTEDLKPPYLLLCNHNAFFDFMVTTVAIFPHRANYVVAIDGFLKREWLLRAVGCICKRKFTNDTILVRQLKRVIQNGDVAVLYPEARYSLCGTTAVLPDSLGKLAKYLDVPVVTLITHGNHIDSPFWNLKKRGTPTEATLRQLLTREELSALPVEEINEKIRREFQYDEYAWQKEKGVRVKAPWRAEGLHKVLYQCPHCKTEYRMNSKGSRLFCEACGKEWELSELGELSATAGKTEFTRIPDWYEWERMQVRREVESGTYSFSAKATVQWLPNAKGYIPLGEATLRHDENGFTLQGDYGEKPYEVHKSVSSMYSCHIEYEYLGKYGDCVDLNTLTDTFYIYPEGHDFSVTKMALATEELYEFEKCRCHS